MGVPPQIEVIFASVEKAAELLPRWESDARVGILLVGDIDTAVALAGRVTAGKTVHVGGCTIAPAGKSVCASCT